MFTFRILFRSLLPAAVLLAFLSGRATLADVADAEAHEVQHLLEYLRSTDCVMERNGERHSGADAYTHVRKKYDYFRDDITTSEEFIDLAATKSTLSGMYYRVLCPGQTPVRSRDWLLRELRRYRRF